MMRSSIAGARGARALFSTAPFFDIDLPATVRDFVRNYTGTFAHEWVQAQAERVGKAIEAGLEAGDPMDVIAGRLGDVFDGMMSPEHAQMIAQTETIRASAVGAMETYRDAGVTSKEWSADPSELTCNACDALDGVKVALDGTFESDEGSVDSPPLHPWCRCSLLPVLPEYGTIGGADADVGIDLEDVGEDFGGKSWTNASGPMTRPGEKLTGKSVPPTTASGMPRIERSELSRTAPGAEPTGSASPRTGDPIGRPMPSASPSTPRATTPGRRIDAQTTLPSRLSVRQSTSFGSGSRSSASTSMSTSDTSNARAALAPSAAGGRAASRSTTTTGPGASVAFSAEVAIAPSVYSGTITPASGAPRSTSLVPDPEGLE